MTGKMDVMFLGPYPPTQNGLGGYIQALVQYLNSRGAMRCRVVAVGDKDTAYGRDVYAHFRKDSRFSHIAAAETINAAGCELLVVEYLNDVYGGSYGEYLLDLLERLDVPYIVKCHAVTSQPEGEQRRILGQICRGGKKAVAQSQIAAKLLCELYDVPQDKVEVVQFGVPEAPNTSREEIKRAYGLEGKTVLSTCGMLAPGRGIEYAIQAVGQLAGLHSGLRYLVWGPTHPALKKASGEEYRASLMALAGQVGVGDRVIFRNHMPNYREMQTLVAMSDVYLMPCLSADWLYYSSLSFAVAGGRVAVSTPIDYAQELLGEGGGLLARFGDAYALADCLRAVLEDPEAKKGMEAQAREIGRAMSMDEVCGRFETLFGACVKSTGQTVYA